MNTVSSAILSKMMNVTDSQIRKDLSYFGSFGKRGVGYNVHAFIEAIENIMNLNQKHNVCIIGAGRLGTALMNYKRMQGMPFKVCAAFDNDKRLIGQKSNDVRIYDIKYLSKYTEQFQCEIAVLTIPSYVVHEIYAAVSKTKIKAILNFTPIILTGTNDLLVRNLDFVSELKIISYHLKENKNAHKG